MNFKKEGNANMPIYAYKCEACGFAKDVLQKMSDPLLTVCPSCGAPAFTKQVTAAGFQLKGTGWYVTDFKDPPKKPAADNATPAAASPEASDAAAGSTKESDSSKAASASEAKPSNPSTTPAAQPKAGTSSGTTAASPSASSSIPAKSAAGGTA